MLEKHPLTIVSGGVLATLASEYALTFQVLYQECCDKKLSVRMLENFKIKSLVICR